MSDTGWMQELTPTGGATSELPSGGWGLDLSSVPAWLSELQKVAQLGVSTYSQVYQIQHSTSPAPLANLPAPLPPTAQEQGDNSSAPLPATADPSTTAPPPGGFTQDMSDFYEAHKTAVIVGGIGLAAIVLIMLLRAEHQRSGGAA